MIVVAIAKAFEWGTTNTQGAEGTPSRKIKKLLTIIQKYAIINTEIEKEIKTMIKTNREEVLVVTYCPFCGEAHEIAVNEDDYFDWQDGELAQNAFPYLSADEREMLISGVCHSCWSAMFGEDD